jgi:hypothetical protein
MSLPILVPTIQELALLGVAVRARLPRRDLHWRTRVALGRVPQQSRPKRSLRFAERTPATVRAQRVAHWSARGSTLDKPPPLPESPWSPRTASTYRHLMRDVEVLLQQILRRREISANASPRAVSAITATFDSSTWRVKVDPVQRDALVCLMISMYWRGCRHPAALYGPTLHPPTALIRWLSRFTVQQQVDHGRQILRLLAEEELRVHEFANSVVEQLPYETAGATCAVALLPDVLRTIEPV